MISTKKPTASSMGKLAFALCFMILPLIGQAQETQPNNSRLRFLINGGLELGGDAVATIGFTNGSSQKVNAGQGISVGVGGELRLLSSEKLRLRGSVGIKYVTTAADNAHIRLTRIPLILTGNWMIDDSWRIGAGLASHQAIRFNAGGIGQNFKLTSPAGPIFEIAYKGIGLSYTMLTYSDELGVAYKANSIGLTFSGVLPK
jgi:hypothetical protein